MQDLSAFVGNGGEENNNIVKTLNSFKLNGIWHWLHSFIIIKMLHVYHNSGLLCFLLEIKEILCRPSCSEALQIQEHSLQNYSSF